MLITGKQATLESNGKTFDEMAEYLDQLGFFPNEDYSANGLLDMVSRAINQGEDVYSPAAMEHQGKLLDLVNQEEDLSRMHSELLADADNIMDTDSAYLAEIYQAVRNGVDFEDIEAAIGDIANPESEFFSNITILQRLRNGDYQAQAQR